MDVWWWMIQKLKWIFDWTESNLNAFKLYLIEFKLDLWLLWTSLKHAMQAMHCRTVSAAHWDVVRCRPRLVCWVLQDVAEASTFLWGDGATDASLEPGWVSMIFMGNMRINQWMQRQWGFPEFIRAKYIWEHTNPLNPIDTGKRTLSESQALGRHL